jgi:tetratricopeptide (TPR) repeat protein
MKYNRKFLFGLLVLYDEAIKLAAKNDLAYYYTNRGVTKLLRGAIRDHNEAIEDYKAALQDFNKALEQKSNFNFPYHFRGTVRYLLGYAKAKHGHSKEARKLYQSAIEDFKAAIKLVNDALDHTGLGFANVALGKAKTARAAFEKAKQLEAESEKQAN